MDRSLLSTFLLVAVASAMAVTHASLAPQIYWHTKLPNSPMPSSIRELLRPESAYEKESTDTEAGKGGVHVDASKGKPGGTSIDVGKGGVGVDVRQHGTTVPVGKAGVSVDAGHSGTTVGVGKGGVDVDAGHGGTTVNVGHGTGVNVRTHHKGAPVVVKVGLQKAHTFIFYAAAADQLHDNSYAAFFQQKDLRTGTKMSLRFFNPLPASTFLPRSVADSLPFSSAKLEEILSKFSIDPSSADAAAIKETLETCEKPAAKGEDRLCATSLESMVDFVTAKLGKDVKAVATAAKEDSKVVTYTVSPAGAQEMKGSESVTCHREAYAYAVYYCHETHDTSAYVVPLVREDGATAEAVAVCHKDTSAWNPKHLAFQVLKVKPGTVPVCHFLPQDHVVWVASN